MSVSQDLAFADFASDQPCDTTPFYQSEGQILELWDQLSEMKLEQAVLGAQTTQQSEGQDENVEITDETLKEAENAHLEARGAWILRQGVVEDVLVADPILKAVHAGENATATEKQLHPLIDRRDTLGIALANLSTTLQSLSKDLMMIEANNIKAMEKNKDLAGTFRSVTRRAQDFRKQTLEDTESMAQLEDLEKETSIARNRWSVMKSVVSAVVAGSGVDWARDATLQKLVLDEEDEDSI